MKLICTIILLWSFHTTAYTQAWVWEKPITTTNNSIATDPNDNIIVLSANGSTATQLSKFTKDGISIWTLLLTKANTFTPSGSVVADNNGNIYTNTAGFDSVNHIFTGIKTRGITKFDPQGNVLWHVTYNASTGIMDAALPLQIDDNNNVYLCFKGSAAGTGNTTVSLGSQSAVFSWGVSDYLSIGSISPDGTARWIRAFRFQPAIGGTSSGLLTGFSVAGNKVFVSGAMAKYKLLLDNGLTLELDRKSAWLAALDAATGQTAWGRTHLLIYYCAGLQCQCGIPRITSGTEAGKVILTNNLNGAFEFSPGVYIASMYASGGTAWKTYYTIYDTSGNPVKGNTVNDVGGQSDKAENLIGTRHHSFFVWVTDTLKKVDTGYNLIWQTTLPSSTQGMYVPKTGSYLIATYTRYGITHLAKMVDGAGVVSGRTYADWDNSGSYNTGDSLLSSILITTNAAPRSISGSDSGKYYLYTMPGSYSLNANFNHPYYEFLPASHTATISTLSDTINGKDFRLRPLFSFTDVSTNFSSLSVARPGTSSAYGVTVSNFGASATAISVGLKLPALTTYTAISGGTVTINSPDSITIEMGIINPFDVKRAVLTLTISTSATINDTLRFYPVAYPYLTDTVKVNNRDTLIQPIRASFDPNEKEVNRERQPIADAGKPLTYTIHFQNTGNDTAFYIRIADTLSSKLNMNTFSFIDASHPVSIEISGNIVNFIFNPIILPDSNQNEPLSHGYVKFKIAPLPPYIALDTTYNRSAIYFDYNAPVITNQTASWYYTGGVVPLILKSFVAEKKTISVLLKFSTASEPGIADIIVERSSDGINFTSIGRVTPRGTSTTGSNYLFEDLLPLKEANFYRLKMVDKDLRISYSWVAIVRFSGNSLEQVSVFPNPVNDNLYISFRNLNTTQPISIRFVDINGKIIWTASADSRMRDTYTINTTLLSNGIYFISVANSSINYHFKVLVKH